MIHDIHCEFAILLKKKGGKNPLLESKIVVLVYKLSITYKVNLTLWCGKMT